MPTQRTMPVSSQSRKDPIRSQNLHPDHLTLLLQFHYRVDVMELPPMNAGADEDGDGGLELTGVVPSAADDDDEEVQVHGLSNDSGFRDEPSSE